MDLSLSKIQSEKLILRPETLRPESSTPAISIQYLLFREGVTFHYDQKTIKIQTLGLIFKLVMAYCHMMWPKRKRESSDVTLCNILHQRKTPGIRQKNRARLHCTALIGLSWHSFPWITIISLKAMCLNLPDISCYINR